MSFGPEMCLTAVDGSVLHMGAAPPDVLERVHADPCNVGSVQLGTTEGYGAAYTDWAITTQRRMLGHVRLLPKNSYRPPEVIIKIYDVADRGNGVGTLALRGLVSAAFSPERSEDVVAASVRLSNLPSRKALVRAGFYPEMGAPCEPTDPSILLEQINPADEPWHRQLGRRDPVMLPTEDVLELRRHASQELLTTTPMHFCLEANCPRVQQEGIRL